ncbi:alpha/beta hydrolase [Kitasatospora sp. NPDC004240]
MSAGFALLMRFDPHGLREAANGWKALAHAVESTGTRHRHQVNGPLHARWTGADAEAAFPYLARTEQQLSVVRAEAESLALTMNTVADRMHQARTDLLNVVRRAQEAGLTVSADGVVALPPEAPGDRNDPDAPSARRALLAVRNELQRRIDTAVQAAQRASDQGNAALGRLGADILTTSRADGATAETRTDVAEVRQALGLSDPYVPDGRDPRQNAAWWQGLTPEQRATYLALDAARIGGLDGLPSAVRDEANRTVLDQRLDALLAGTPASLGLDREAYDRRLAALRAIRDKLTPPAGTDDRVPRSFLLRLDPEAYEGDGRAVVATGDPDRAAHTAVLVPGTNTDLGGVPGQIDRIRQLRSHARAFAGPGEEVSVISYLGYDAPESIPEAVNPRRGIDGAEDMRRFSEGIRVAHGEPRTHLTYIGHSYGSYAVGVAAAGGEDGLRADDIVALGSPGMGVSEAKDLHIDPGRVWISEARDDPTRVYSGMTLGPGPHNLEFGGTNLYTDTSGHSGYWDENSESVRNQGKIIAGKPPEVAPKEVNIGGIIPVRR